MIKKKSSSYNSSLPKEFSGMGDDESFSQSNNIPDEIEENQINNYQNIFKIEENLVNESEKKRNQVIFYKKKKKK